MSDALPPLFDFSPYVGQSERYLQTIKEFAAGRAFRSASVDELVLEDDFHRRPLRPEDFEFLKFAKPVRADNVSRLPSLASQRTLNCLYELTTAAPPASSDATRNAAFQDFASERNRQYAAQLAPFLEAYAFGYLSPEGPVGAEAADWPSRLGRIYGDEVDFLTQLFADLSAREYLQEGLRFVLIQRWCLAPSIRKVLAEAHARGHFVDWPAGTAPQLNGRLLGDEALAQLAGQVGVDRQQHSFWQFYLPTSLSRCNLVYALARRPERAFELYGALFAMEALWLAFETAIARSCPHLTSGFRVEATTPEKLIEQLQRRFTSASRFVSERRAPDAVARLGQGLVCAETLAERARWDLGEQLKWLSAIDRYCAHARTISRRIEAECPGIDRETFVEPRDMCSTTHVHNDHRLVTIETGVMHFWGNLGMRLEMNRGDMVLIPDGRLHGSTVLSAECTYHQPIIPDEWVRDVQRAAGE